MPYQVAVLNFEGPLDLLLQLVERARLETHEVSLAAVTEQYIDYISQLDSFDTAETGHFSALAAKLLYIKSSRLLPGDVDDEIAEFEETLAVYGRNREAATILARLMRATPQATRTANAFAGTTMAPNATASTLKAAFSDALRRQQPQQHIAPKPAISLAEMSERLQQLSGTTTLQQFFSGLSSKQELVVAFIAALELWRQGHLRLSQRGQFSIIYVDHAATH